MKHLKPVPFKVAEGLPKHLLEHISEKAKGYGVHDITLFNINRVVIGEWVHLKCRYGCSRYDTNWCCPPATPSREKVKKILGEYSWGLLLTGHQAFPEFYRENSAKRSRQVRYWKGTVSLERLLFLEGYYKAFSLVGVPCALCKDCAYPQKCLFPQEKRPSIESFSIDMIGTLKKIGITTNVAGRRQDSFSYYSMILLQ